MVSDSHVAQVIFPWGLSRRFGPALDPVPVRPGLVGDDAEHGVDGASHHGAVENWNHVEEILALDSQAVVQERNGRMPTGAEIQVGIEVKLPVQLTELIEVLDADFQFLIDARPSGNQGLGYM